MAMLLSERLLALLTEEIAVLRVSLSGRNSAGAGGALHDVAAVSCSVVGSGPAAGARGRGAAAGAGRVSTRGPGQGVPVWAKLRLRGCLCTGRGSNARYWRRRPRTVWIAMDRPGPASRRAARGRSVRATVWAARGTQRLDRWSPPGAAGDAARKGRGRARTARTVAGVSKDDHTASADSAGRVARVGRAGGGRSKDRAEALGQLTRTLEKLLELKRLETLAGQGGTEDRAETERLRAEFLTALRNLDARRRAGPTLFDPQTGAYAGHMPAGFEPESPADAAGSRDTAPG